MKFEELPKLKIGTYESQIPLLLGGMGVGITRSRLASAVANEGGMGVIAAVGIGMYEPDFNKDNAAANLRGLRKEIGIMRKLTKGVVGVNVMYALTNFENIIATCLEEEADLIVMGAGMPMRLGDSISAEQIRSGKTRFVVIVSSARAANLIFRAWERNYDYIPDAVVVEGPRAGGHLGFKKEQINDPEYALEKILPEVVSVVNTYGDKHQRKIPVIAAGGIYTGEDIYNIMKLGADGVQMATRFIGTYECDASEEFKRSLIECTEDDIEIITSPVGMPGRAIRNSFIDEVKLGHRMPFACPWKCLKTCDYATAPYCIALALVNAEQGKMNKGFAFVGANAPRVKSIVSVKELVDELKLEYEAATIQALTGEPALIKIKPADTTV
jgi:NAD(P)H-dependent flavin oxidoreductase YrpB (nitropropane dioxygenase family)